MGQDLDSIKKNVIKEVIRPKYDKESVVKKVIKGDFSGATKKLMAKAASAGHKWAKKTAIKNQNELKKSTKGYYNNKPNRNLDDDNFETLSPEDKKLKSKLDDESKKAAIAIRQKNHNDENSLKTKLKNKAKKFINKKISEKINDNTYENKENRKRAVRSAIRKTIKDYKYLNDDDSRFKLKRAAVSATSPNISVDKQNKEARNIMDHADNKYGEAVRNEKKKFINRELERLDADVNEQPRPDKYKMKKYKEPTTFKHLGKLSDEAMKAKKIRNNKIKKSMQLKERKDDE